MQELGIEQSEDDIEIAITQTYLQVLYAYEAVRINENTVEVSTAQRDRSAELMKAGSIFAYRHGNRWNHSLVRTNTSLL